MIDLNKHKNIIEELSLLYKYIKKKILTLIIICGIVSIISIIGIAICTSDDEIINPLFYLFIVLLFLNWLLLIPIIKYSNAFTYGNYQSTIFDIVEKETEYSFKEVLDKKERTNFFVTNTNVIDKYSGFQAIFFKDVYDKEDLVNKKITYSYINVTYSKNASFSGYAICIPITLNNIDCKVLPTSLYMAVKGYKLDKNVMIDNKNIYYYNKNNEYEYNIVVEKIYKYIKEQLNNIYQDEVDFGLFLYNGMLTIIIKYDKKHHPIVGFPLNFKEYKIEKLINVVLNDLNLTIKNIIPFISEVE